MLCLSLQVVSAEDQKFHRTHRIPDFHSAVDCCGCHRRHSGHSRCWKRWSVRHNCCHHLFLFHVGNFCEDLCKGVRKTVTFEMIRAKICVIHSWQRCCASFQTKRILLQLHRCFWRHNCHRFICFHCHLHSSRSVWQCCVCEVSTSENSCLNVDLLKRQHAVTKEQWPYCVFFCFQTCGDRSLHSHCAHCENHHGEETLGKGVSPCCLPKQAQISERWLWLGPLLHHRSVHLVGQASGFPLQHAKSISVCEEKAWLFVLDHLFEASLNCLFLFWQNVWLPCHFLQLEWWLCIEIQSGYVLDSCGSFSTITKFSQNLVWCQILRNLLFHLLSGSGQIFWAQTQGSLQNFQFVQWVSAVMSYQGSCFDQFGIRIGKYLCWLVHQCFFRWKNVRWISVPLPSWALQNRWPQCSNFEVIVKCVFPAWKIFCQKLEHI